MSDAELQRLAQVGFRGVRFNFMRHIAYGRNIDTVMALTPQLAAVGMHLQVHFEIELVHELSAPFQRSQVPVVIDHMGRVDATRGLLARALVQRFAERCVWGSDWPHPNHTHVPDDGVLVDALAEIAPNSDLQEQLLVRNPAALYKFLMP